MRGLLTFVLLTSILSSATLAKPREVRRLKPTGQWVLNYADESCQLGRDFGEGPDKVTLILYQLQPGDDFKLTFVGSIMEPAPSARSGSLKFGPNEAESDVYFIEGTSGKDRILMIDGTERLAPLTEIDKRLFGPAHRDRTFFRLDPIGPEREKAATWLALKNIMKFDLVLETGPMYAAMEALRHCTWDLVDSWGLDVEQQKTLSRKAHPKNSRSWFNVDDYPVKMLRSDSEAIVNFRIMVDTAGRPQSCHIQVSTRPKEFDEVVCKIMMKRARFHPALDAQGQPVNSFYQSSTSFRIENW